MNMPVSDICLHPRGLTEIVSRREDGRNPEAHEEASLLAGAHANAKPQGHRKQERQESRRKNQPISFIEHHHPRYYTEFVLQVVDEMAGWLDSPKLNRFYQRDNTSE